MDILTKSIEPSFVDKYVDTYFEAQYRAPMQFLNNISAFLNKKVSIGTHIYAIDMMRNIRDKFLPNGKIGIETSFALRLTIDFCHPKRSVEPIGIVSYYSNRFKEDDRRILTIRFHNEEVNIEDTPKLYDNILKYITSDPKDLYGDPIKWKAN